MAAKFAREKKVPFFGICLGMQMAVVEAARNLAKIENASSEEFHYPYSKDKKEIVHCKSDITYPTRSRAAYPPPRLFCSVYV